MENNEELIPLTVGGFVPGVPGMWGKGVLHVPQDGSAAYLLPFEPPAEVAPAAQDAAPEVQPVEQSVEASQDVPPHIGIGG